MPVKPVNSLDEFNEIINKDKVVFVDFWADWCGQCTKIWPEYEKHSNETPDAEFYKVNVEEQPDIVNELVVYAMPTFMAYRKGEKLGEIVGSSKEKLDALVKSVSSP